MRRFQILLLFIAISCSMFAQDRLSLFIGRANKYASVEVFTTNYSSIFYKQ